MDVTTFRDTVIEDSDVLRELVQYIVELWILFIILFAIKPKQCR